MQIDPRDGDKTTNYRIMRNLVIPRPIALVSTLNEAGRVNVAPFSFFGVVSAHPPVIGISIGSRKGLDKDTMANARRTRELVINLTTEDMKNGMIISAMDFPPDESEVEPSGFTTTASTVVRPPRIAESPAQMECRVTEIMEFGESHQRRNFVIAEVVMFHVDDACLRNDGLPDHLQFGILGRLGDDYYWGRKGSFELKRTKYENWLKTRK
ncbi:MAG: flavin reductase family protein [Deltaproteobacteria bacterium]|jgi:flavin reductase (DIM6/NTAB) family NADH-FMN oxidoreductase RutF|nr:flavin reductase family protein [Deltaproteobacteria bacterium]